MATAFTPKQTFTANVNDKPNTYVQGKKYTCRDGAMYADLRSKLASWVDQDLITVLGDVPNRPPVAAVTT